MILEARGITPVLKGATKKAPLKKRVEKFRVVKRSGNKEKNYSPLFSASIIEWKFISPSLADPLLVSVSRVSGSAVLRNRWKRLIREWFATSGFKITPGQSIWIRFNRTKLLKKPLLYKEWADMLTSSTSVLLQPHS